MRHFVAEMVSSYTRNADSVFAFFLDVLYSIFAFFSGCYATSRLKILQRILCKERHENHLTSYAHSEINSMVALIARELWLERNARSFDKTAVMPVELCGRTRATFELWKKTGLCGHGGGIQREITLGIC
jgi:hypothetical protein